MTVDILTYNDCDFDETYIVTALDMTSLSAFGDLPSLRMMVKKNAEDAGAFLDLSTANGRLTYAATTDGGTVRVQIPLAAFGIMPAGAYVHSLIHKFPATGIKTEVWRGTLTHAIGPTRWTTPE